MVIQHQQPTDDKTYTIYILDGEEIVDIFCGFSYTTKKGRFVSAKENAMSLVRKAYEI